MARKNVMAKACGADVQVLGVARRDRASLLRGTALQAAVLTVIALPAGMVHQAAAQPAPNARPTGGQVVAGSAAISQPTASTTVITQTTNRAAVNWTSFNVGSQQSVDFVQPSASAMTLNRVTGPDPSAIAGQIHANGGVVLTNPNGVVFYKGSQVNAQDVIVSTPGITNQNFMAGRMVFDQPGRADARIENAGTITVRDTGLAALVAPQVANSGVISARLGRAVLAGAEAATLDMYGDGLLSVDVTKQVTQTPKGGAALVTNTGTIVASGGQVVMTAQAADGVVQNLVSAGGSVLANSVGAKTGAITIGGTGGSIVISGRLAAAGFAAGTTGGTIELNASKNVTLTPTARVDASGAAGGGTVAVGTSLARAVGGPSVTPVMTAATTTIAAGARVTANATRSGNGGRVTVLANNRTVLSGTVEAKGGRIAGNGGTVEVSTGGSILLDGQVDVTAPHGKIGDITLDPYDLIISSSTSTTGLIDNTDPNLAYSAVGTTPGFNATITPAQLTALHGNIHLQAVDNITVSSPIVLTTAGQGLELEAGNNLTVSSGTGISVAGNIQLIAASAGIPGFNSAGALLVAAPVTSTGGSVLLQGGSGAGNIIIADHVSAAAGSFVDLKSDTISIYNVGQSTPLGGAGGLVVAANGQVIVEPVTAGHNIELIGAATAPSAGTLSLGISEVALITTSTLTLGNSTAGAINIGLGGDPVSLSTVNQLNLVSAGAVSQSAALTVGTLSGAVASAIMVYPTNAVGTLGAFSATGGIALQDAGALTVAGPVASGATAFLGAGGAIALTGNLTGATVNFGTPAAVTQSAGAITATTLTGSVGSGTLAGANQITAISTFASAGAFTLNDLVPLTVNGPLSVTAGALTIADTGAMTLAGTLAAPTINLGATGAISQSGGALNATTVFAQGTSVALGGTNSITNLGSLTATTGVATLVDVPTLNVVGPVSGPGGINLTSTTGNLVLGGTLTTSTASSTSLVARGAITEGAGGVIITGTLNGGDTLGTSLGNLNEIGNIGSFAGAGGFSLAQDATSLTILGNLTDTTSVSLSTQGQIFLGGTLAAPSVSLATTKSFPPLNSGTSVVTAGQLAAVESIIQTGGGVVAGTLSISSAGGVNMLPGSGNSIANLGTISVATLFNLNDPQSASLTVIGPATVTGPTINAGVGNDFYYQFYANTPGALTVSAPINGAVVGLFAGGALTETAGGAVIAQYLLGSGGSVLLGQATNQIGEVDQLTSAANLVLSDAVPLTVNGPVSAGAGNTLIINNDSLSLGASAAISTFGGTVDLAPLNPGDALAIGNGAGITGLTAITADTLILGSTTAGPVTVNTTASNFDASGVNTLGLVSASSVSDSGAFGIIANTLTGNAGSAALVGANQITTVGSFTTAGLFALLTSNPSNVPLTIAGPLTASIALVNSATSPIAIAGPVTAATVSLTQTGAPGGITESGGSITATTLNVTEGATGAVALTSTTNTIAGIGTVSAGSGGFSLVDATGLSVIAGAGGITSTGPVSLNTTGALAIGAPVGSATATLSLVAGGTLTEGAAGALIGTTLTGQAAGTNLGQTTNAVTTLGAFTSTGGFNFVDGTALTVTGPVTDTASIAIGSAGALSIRGSLAAPAVALATTTGAISLAAGITAPNGLLLSTSGPVTQSAGVITSALLTGSAGSAVLGSANSIANLGSFTATGALSLSDALPIVVAGPVTAAAVNLASAGTISQTAAGTITTASLTGGATTVTLTAANQVSGLGPFASGSTFSLTDTVPVTISGTVSAGSGTSITLADNAPSFGTGGALSAPGGVITFAPSTAGATLTLGGAGGAATTANQVVIGSATGGPVSITGVVNLAGVSSVLLQSGGAITETAAGALSAPLVTGSAASVALGGPNTIASLGSFTSGGPFALNDISSLTLTGPLKGGAVTLVSGGTLTEGTGSSITATSLAGSAAVANLGGANAIPTLGAFTTTTGFVLNDSVPLSVAGPTSLGGVAAITVAGSLDVAGTLAGTSLTLVPSGALTESTGVINAGTLAGSATTASLTGANAIGTLGNFASPGGFVITDLSPLTIAGAVTAGPFATLNTSGLVSETAGGSITATSLVAGVGTLALSGPNSIGTLSSASAPGGPLLNDTVGLTVTGPAGGAGATTLIAAGPITVAGSVTGSSVTLAATGAVTESGSNTITTGSLSGSGSSIVLANANTIGALGSISAGSGLTLVDQTGLVVTGAVSGGTVLLNINGPLTESGSGAITTASLAGSTANTVLGGPNAITAVGSLSTTGNLLLNNAGNLAITGPINGGVVSLGSSGAISESGGVITAGTLSVTAALATLNASNVVTQLGPVTTTTGLSLTTSGGLTVSGPVNAGGVLQLATAGALAIVSPVSAATVTLVTAGAVTEGGAGAITTGNLTGNVPSATLGGANAVSGLGGFTATGVLTLNDIAALTVTGPASASAVTLVDSAGIAVAGNLSTGATSTLTLSSGGAVTQTGGVITTGTLTGSAGSLSLGGANVFPTLGAFSGGALAFNDTVPLTVAGPVSASSLSVADNGAVGFTGGVSVGALNVNAGGSILQSTGTITAGLLTGSAVGSAVFGPDAPAPVANIGTLGSFLVTGGTLSVASGQAMTVTGPITASTLNISAPGNVTLAGGTINTTTGTIAVLGSTGTPQIAQTGVTTINPASTTAPATLVFQLPGGGTINFADLEARTSSVVLNTGNGTATGVVNVGVLSVVGQSGGATLSGSVAGQVGPGAALASGISPAIDTNYTLNGCVIAAASCTAIFQPPQQPVQQSSQQPVIESIILPPNAGFGGVVAAEIADSAGASRSAFRVPFLSGLLAFVFSRDVDDPDVVLPNISDRDY